MYSMHVDYMCVFVCVCTACMYVAYMCVFVYKRVCVHECVYVQYACM